MNRFTKRQLKQKLPALAVLLGSFAIIAATADYSQLSVPTQSGALLERKTIVLDAGHGGLDSGAVGIDGTLEKNINLAIVKNLRTFFELSGFNVVLTRDADVSIHDSDAKTIREQKISDMENRLEIVRKYKEGIFLSIHQNKYTEPEPHGAQIFYNENNPDNKFLAQVMQDNFKSIQPDNDREIKLSGDELYLFKNTSCPAVLIECGFLSNPEDAENLSSEEYQIRTAYIIYNGIVRYLQTVS